MEKLSPGPGTCLIVTAALVLGGCAAGPRIDTSYTSQNHDSRVQYLVLHFTSEPFEPSLKTLTGGNGTVSSHYLVRDDPPTVYRLVDEGRRSWHAGVSSWRGQTELNAASIGIEIVNRGEIDGVWQEYPRAQMDAVMALVRAIVKRHQIRPERIVGHSDIAPQRKVDPGPKFPWRRLADEGLIPWPDAAEVARRTPAFVAALPDARWFQGKLAAHGYAVPQAGILDGETMRVIAAFQMRYRPRKYDGVPDAETAAMLDVLVGR